VVAGLDGGHVPDLRAGAWVHAVRCAARGGILAVEEERLLPRHLDRRGHEGRLEDLGVVVVELAHVALGALELAGRLDE
jgi:hypothetical protein